MSSINLASTSGKSQSVSHSTSTFSKDGYFVMTVPGSLKGSSFRKADSLAGRPPKRRLKQLRSDAMVAILTSCSVHSAEQ